MSDERRSSLSRRIFIGLLLGVITGIFLGERAAPLGTVGRAYIGLLQMSILPYMVASLIAGIGGMDYTKARRLAVTGGIVLLGSWLIAFVVIYLMPLAFPKAPAGSFFSPSMVEQAKVDFIDLYIPVNPFSVMARTVVPATAVFSVVFGIALIGVRHKKPLLDFFTATQETLTRIAMMVIQLSPFGIFAIAANAAGTLSIADIGRLQVYIIVFIVATLVMTFVILPGLASILTPFSYRAILRGCRAALITGFVTGNLFIVLPMLIEQAKSLFREIGAEDEDTARYIEVLIPTSFNFPNIGKLITLIFVLFAGWFSGTEIPLQQYPTFSLLGLFTLFGGVDLALPFLLDQMHIPADLYQLYVVTGVINGWFATLLAVMNLFTFTLVATAAAIGTLRINWRRLGQFLLLTVLLMAGLIGTTRFVLSRLLANEHIQATTLLQMTIDNPAPAKVFKWPPKGQTGASGSSPLRDVLEGGVLRVGYNADNLPFTFFNDQGELVGYDIALCHRLARELGVRLEFIPWTYKTLIGQLKRGEIHLAVGGILITPGRLRKALFTEPYMNVTLGLLVPDYRRNEFSTWEAVDNAGLRLGVPGKTLAAGAAKFMPAAEIVKLQSYEEFFSGKRTGLDGVVISAEAGAAWTTIHPEYSVVVPEPHIATPVAFALAPGELEWRIFLDTWLTLQRSRGFLKTLYDTWILGKGVKKKYRRWSVLDDVLHWSGG